MKLLYPNSLGATLDAIDEALFCGKPIPARDRKQTAEWIASRQGLPGSYAGMIAPTEDDLRQGVTVFTGERVRSRAGTAHIMGEEACRALILLGAQETGAADGLAAASVEMMTRLNDTTGGMYCCVNCSCSLWRHLAAGGLRDPELHLRRALSTLKAHRAANGRWNRFPFYYTLLAVSEMTVPGAKSELRHAAPACERCLRRVRADDKYAARRIALAERVLARV